MLIYNYYLKVFGCFKTKKKIKKERKVIKFV